MPVCKFCEQEKKIDEFVIRYGKYRKCCKKCHMAKYYRVKPKKPLALTRNSLTHRTWKKEVKERDGHKCKKCNATEKLHVHHIVPWKEKEELRFDVDNGQTLCATCHLTYEANLRDARPPINPDNQFKKGQSRVAWNKGIKLRKDQINGKETQFKKGHISPRRGKKIDLPEACKATQFKKGISASPATQFKKGQVAWNKGLKKVE